MIFEFRSIHEIGDDEIAALVRDGERERQRLEFKATFDNRDPRQKLELLRDVVSFANSRGGYLLYGIREDGNGNANGYSGLSQADAERIKNAIASLSHDHIKERIEGLEVVNREVETNHIVIVRVPDTSKKPHMVTLDGRTDFWYRNHDGKREMDIGQIGAAFRGDFNSQQLNTIMTKIEEISLKLSDFEVRLEGPAKGVGELEYVADGQSLLQRHFEQFEAAVEQNG